MVGLSKLQTFGLTEKSSKPISTLTATVTPIFTTKQSPYTLSEVSAIFPINKNSPGMVNRCTAGCSCLDTARALDVWVSGKGVTRGEIKAALK